MLVDLNAPNVQADAQNLQYMYGLQSTLIVQDKLLPTLDATFLSKAHVLDNMLQINHPSALLAASATGTGMEAWSVEEMRRRGKERLDDASRRGEVVPIHQVFDRIRQETQVTAPASVVDEIDKAFKKLELAAATTSLEHWPELPSPLSPLANTTPSELQVDFMTGHKNPLQVGSQAVALQPGPGELVSGLASKAAPGGLSGASILAAQDDGASPTLPAMSSQSCRALLATSPSAPRPPSLPALQLPPSSPAPEHSPSLLQVTARLPSTPLPPPPPRPTPNKLDALFTEVTPPLLTRPATPTHPTRPTSPLQVRRRLSLSRFDHKTRKTK